MPLSDYFNYTSTFSTVLFLVALFILIPLGLFLCRYKLKFILISILGLIQTTVYLSQMLMLVVNYLKTTNHNITGLFFEYAIPVGFFLVAALGIVRCGLQISVNRTQPNPLKSLSHYLPLKTRLQQWRQGFSHWITSPEGIGVCAIEALVLTVHLIFISQPTSAVILDEGVLCPGGSPVPARSAYDLPAASSVGQMVDCLRYLRFRQRPGWLADFLHPFQSH